MLVEITNIRLALRPIPTFLESEHANAELV